VEVVKETAGDAGVDGPLVDVCGELGREGGREVVEGRMRRMSQWMFRARSSGVERLLGRIIQRITRDMIRGLRVSLWECRACRKSGRVVEGVRERRWIAQMGILMLECDLGRDKK
jgi:hypothetical protein